MTRRSTSTKASAVRFSKVKWKDADSALAFVEQAFADKLEYNRTFEAQATLNTAWYAGYQELLLRGNALTRAPNPHGRPRLIYNYIQPLLDGRLAKIGFDPVNFELLPATPDLQDADTARLGTRVLGYYQRRLQMADLVEENDRWAALTGESFVKVTWDPYAGEEIDALGESGLSQSEFKNVYGAEPELTEGDLCVAVVSSLNLFWGPRGVPYEKADWVLEVSERSRQYVAERYELSEAELDELGNDDEITIHRLSDVTAGGVLTHTVRDDDVCIVKELWVRPTAKLPKGWHTVVVGKFVPRNGPNPYDHRLPPHVRFRDVIVPGRERGMSVVDQLIGPQSDLNANMSQQVMIRHLMSNPKWAVRQGSLRNTDEIGDDPGEIIEYLGDKEPHLIQGAGLPNSCIATMQQTMRFMQDIAAQRDVSQARVPSGVRSGVAIRALQEADDARTAASSRRRREGWEQVGRLMIKTAAQFVREERMGRVLSDENRWEVFRFNGEMLYSNGRRGVSEYDVVVSTSGLPRSRIAATEQMQFLTQNGWLSPENPAHRRMVFRTLELGIAVDGGDSQAADRHRAQVENEMMGRGELAQVRSMDSDDAHLAEHEWYRKQEFFRELDPKLQLLFELHCEMHRMAMAEKAAKPQILMMQAIAKLQAKYGVLPPPAAGGAPPAKSEGRRANAAA